MFGRGGVLQQYDAPARLLSNPANDAVAAFVGADRGYRGLQFYHATGLPLHDIRHVGEPGDRCAGTRSGDWVLVTRPDGAPYAWIDADGVELHRNGGSLYDSTIAGAHCSGPTARCGWRWMRRCLRRRGWAWPSTPPGRCSAG